MSEKKDSKDLITNETGDTTDTERREAVKTLGKFAAAAPMMVSLLVSSRSSAASAGRGVTQVPV